MNTEYFIDENLCKQCSLCVEVCPNTILKSEHKVTRFRDDRLHLCFQCGHCMAVCETKAVHIPGLDYDQDFFEIPDYQPDLVRKSFFDLISTRRAIRNFKNKPVPGELLDRIVEAIYFAPPGFPPLKYRLIVVEDPEKIRQALPYMTELYDKLLGMMKKSMIRRFIRKEVGKKRFRTLDEHLIPLLKKRIPELKEGGEDTLSRGAPAMILFLAEKDGEDISQDISIAATFGMLASHALGLGGSIMDIIAPAINKHKKLRAHYRVPENMEVITSLIIGYPKYKYRRGIKRQPLYEYRIRQN
jgi:nitroreductase/NAD-dependent dihydropyrimidine dehydrogenase PreA subunit